MRAPFWLLAPDSLLLRPTFGCGYAALRGRRFRLPILCMVITIRSWQAKAPGESACPTTAQRRRRITPSRKQPCEPPDARPLTERCEDFWASQGESAIAAGRK